MKKKILIIDDDVIFLEELKEIIEANGFNAISLKDPLLVKEVVKAEKPDLILLDLKMPGKSGFQVADELKHATEFSRLPVIAMSGFFTQTEHYLLMQLCGIQKCIKKPFPPAEMLNLINLALENRA
ncbi:MAG: response regulator [bacterium]|nr:response regulator [bacterium]MDD5756610.1 response regulator [bacterium]